MTTLMCTCATPPDDARLLAFLDGEPDPGLAADLAKCASCRERLATLDVQQRSLMMHLRQSDTPSSLELEPVGHDCCADLPTWQTRFRPRDRTRLAR